MTYPRQLTNPAQSAWPVILNENGTSLAGVALYAPDGYGTFGLNLGYFGGHVEGTPVADGTVALTGSATNYIVANRTTGVVSASTGTTNWNDAAYGRVCVAPTTSGDVDWSGFEDWRTQAGGIFRAPVGTGTGTVTSVAATVPSFLSISGSPITTTGTLAITYSGTALPVDNGGTGATTLTANNVLLGNGTSALQVVAPGTSGNVLTSNGSTWASTAPVTGGDFSSNTGTSVDSEIVLFSGTAGKTGKRATGTGYAKVTSGVLSADSTATVRTDLQGDGLTDAVVGFRNIPQNSQSTAYTTVAADSGKHLLHPSADTTARTFTIDSNANVAYPIGTAITIVNQNAAGVITIAITSDTMRLAGAGTTGSRTLAANGVATALKITSTEWIISGTGLT